jgi:hypothetical protein
MTSLDDSTSPARIRGVQPRVAVMQNGTRKGAGMQTMTTLRSVDGAGRHLAVALVVQCRNRAEQRRRVHRQRGPTPRRLRTC